MEGGQGRVQGEGEEEEVSRKWFLACACAVFVFSLCIIVLHCPVWRWSSELVRCAGVLTATSDGLTWPSERAG